MYDSADNEAIKASCELLKNVRAGGDVRRVLQAMRPCIPETAAALFTTVNPSRLDEMAFCPIDLSPPILEAWLQTHHKHLEKALQLVFQAQEGAMWRDLETIGGDLRSGLQVLEQLEHYGLGEGAGYKVTMRPGKTGQEHVFLALLTERGASFSPAAARRLHALRTEIRKAVALTELPFIPSTPIFGQIVAKRAQGYICVDANGNVVEANRRAHEWALAYGPQIGVSTKRERLQSFAHAVDDRQCIQSTKLYQRLEIDIHQIAGAPHDLSGETSLIVLTERGGLHPKISNLSPARKRVAILWMFTTLLAKEIADHIGRSERTVKKHLEVIYDILNVHSREELIKQYSSD